MRRHTTHSYFSLCTCLGYQAILAGGLNSAVVSIILYTSPTSQVGIGESWQKQPTDPRGSTATSVFAEWSKHNDCYHRAHSCTTYRTHLLVWVHIIGLDYILFFVLSRLSFRALQDIIFSYHLFIT